VKVIAERIWREPAAAVGLLTSVALALLAVASSAPWDASVIAGIAAPFLSALGIRQVVSPAAGPRPDEPPVEGPS
jgi:CTP:molybdopterin cytidylyltransferase MocA